MSVHATAHEVVVVSSVVDDVLVGASVGSRSEARGRTAVPMRVAVEAVAVAGVLRELVLVVPRMAVRSRVPVRVGLIVRVGPSVRVRVGPIMRVGPDVGVRVGPVVAVGAGEPVEVTLAVPVSPGVAVVVATPAEGMRVRPAAVMVVRVVGDRDLFRDDI